MIIVWLWNSYSCYEDADACNLFYTFYVEWVVSAAWDQWWRQEPTMFLRLFGETRLPGVLLKFSNKRSHFCVLLGLWLPMLTCELTTSSSSCPSPSPTGPCHLPLSRSESETSCQWLGWTSLCGGLTTAGQPQVHIWGRLWASLMFRCASLDWSTTSGVFKKALPRVYPAIIRSLVGLCVSSFTGIYFLQIWSTILTCVIYSCKYPHWYLLCYLVTSSAD